MNRDMELTKALLEYVDVHGESGKLIALSEEVIEGYSRDDIIRHFCSCERAGYFSKTYATLGEVGAEVLTERGHKALDRLRSVLDV